ncbi:MAG TPA: hypothetical protein VLZ89_08445, partial [Anaerolineales bacterium]|nr:hypothetical protein [Anaerolineales bacterium]
ILPENFAMNGLQLGWESWQQLAPGTDLCIEYDAPCTANALWTSVNSSNFERENPQGQRVGA